jgi:hypothetical protein
MFNPMRHYKITQPFTVLLNFKPYVVRSEYLIFVIHLRVNLLVRSEYLIFVIPLRVVNLLLQTKQVDTKLCALWPQSSVHL